MKRHLLLLGLLGACVPAFFLARQTPPDGPSSPVVEGLDAGPLELPSSILLPRVFRWQHAGTLEQLRPFAHLMPEGTELSDFTFVASSCRVQVPLGKSPALSGKCPQAEPQLDGGDSAAVAPLQWRLFGRDLVDGVWPVEGMSADGWKPNIEDLGGLRALLAIPPAEQDMAIESVRVVAGEKGDWLGFELTVKEAPIAAFGRWQLAMRYGKDPNYGRDVLSWGDGQRLLWALRLTAGGFGMEMTQKRIRLVLVSGADWEPRLSELLRELPAENGPLPVPGQQGLRVRVTETGLRLETEKSPLPTRGMLGQLRGALRRWSAP